MPARFVVALSISLTWKALLSQQKFAPGGDKNGCEVVLACDATDPGGPGGSVVDIYTALHTPYPSLSRPAAHFFFPSFFYHVR